MRLFRSFLFHQFNNIRGEWGNSCNQAALHSHPVPVLGLNVCQSWEGHFTKVHWVHVVLDLHIPSPHHAKTLSVFSVCAIFNPQSQDKSMMNPWWILLLHHSREIFATLNKNKGISHSVKSFWISLNILEIMMKSVECGQMCLHYLTTACLDTSLVAISSGETA